ncbi:MAG TPA: YceI family protein [Thermoanaerobaculia bacterium]|nr:YceI family protein [Thermoanaerobaculia bacterium]
MKLIRSILVIALFTTPLFAQTADTFSLDKAHSNATFRVRHLMSNVNGSFRDFDIAVNLDRANPSGSSVEFTIQTASIDTGNTNRDDHLRSPDFFEVAKYPTITFKSTSVKAASKDKYDVTGDLTMHGVTKKVTLPVEFLGFMKDARGNERAGFAIATTINRKDYGIVWNRALDEGAVLLGEDVKVSIDLEVIRKAAEPAAAPAK